MDSSNACQIDKYTEYKGIREYVINKDQHSNISSPKTKRTSNSKISTPTKYTDHKSITQCEYSPSGILLGCTIGDTLSIQSPVEGLSLGITQLEQFNPTCTISFMNDTSLLHTTTNGSIRVLDMHSGKYTRVFNTNSTNSTDIKSISCNQNTNTCISVEESTTYIWDIRHKDPIGKIPGQKTVIAKYSPDTKIFCLFFEEINEMKLFDSRAYTTGPYTTKRIKTNGYSNALFSRNSLKMALVHPDTITVINGLTGKILGTIPKDPINTNTSLAFSNDSKYILTPETTQIDLYDTSTFKKVHSIPNPHTAPIKQILFNPNYHQFVILSDTLSLYQIDSEISNITDITDTT
ncbi:COMPASS component SWD2 [Nematocida sp. AWRm80]|nr:COMPASS component SWD2 [Nematocida sp. AWRm80]